MCSLNGDVTPVKSLDLETLLTPSKPSTSSLLTAPLPRALVPPLSLLTWLRRREVWVLLDLPGWSCKVNAIQQRESLVAIEVVDRR